MLLLLLLAATTTAAGQPLAGGGWRPRVDYACDGGGRLPVWYEDKEAMLFLDGRLERLPSVPAASGARYANATREWFTKGDEGRLSAVGTTSQAQVCRLTSLATWMPAPGTQRYTCAGGAAVEVSHMLEVATVTFNGVSTRMREVALPAGTLYTDGTRAWRGPADARQLAEADGDAVFARDCRPDVPARVATLSGTVAYKTRQALPKGSVIEVRLADVSRADAPADLLARQVIVTGGEQVPVAFALNYTPEVIQPRRRYVVQATITIDRRVQFRTTTAHIVFESGPPAGPVAILVDAVR
jgi:putative lipoprotein